MKPTAEWNEDDVMSLPAGEDDSFDRKATKALDLTAGANEDAVRNELAKQLSAFANTGGGRIIYGLKDDGSVDSGGISKIMKGRQSTKDWLENLIPNLTAYEIVGVNVYEILPKSSGSKIDSAKALYIVDIPDSDRAPHQSTRDHLYYVRLGQKSQPAPHRLIEDIRNRSKHPNINLTLSLDPHLRVTSALEPHVIGDISLGVKVRLDNVGVLKSQNTCFTFRLRHMAMQHFIDDSEVKTRYPQGGDAYWELVNPFYPGLHLQRLLMSSSRFMLSVPKDNLVMASWRTPETSQAIDQYEYSWNLFADNAPMKQGSGILADLGFNREMREALLALPQGYEIQSRYKIPGYN